MILLKLYLREPTNVRNQPSLYSMFSKRDPIEALGFNELHTVTLGLDLSKEFKIVMALIPREEIDQPDRTGRTSLSWASELGESDKIKILLMRGADPNIADVRGKTPLMYCVHDVTCLSILLEAGAHANDKDIRGTSVLMQLIHGGDNVAGAELLRQFGADLNYQKDSISGGHTIIHTVLQYTRPQLVNWLLDHDINIEVRNDFGVTPLLEFLDDSQGSSPGVLEIVMKKKPDYQAFDNFHEGLLHYLARFGSRQYITTLQQQADLSGLDVEQKSIGDLERFKRSVRGKTAQQLAEWRRDCQSEWAIDNSMPLDQDPHLWYATFESLIRSIKSSHNGNAEGTNITGLGSEASDEGSTTLGEQNAMKDHVAIPRLPGSFPIDDGE